MEWEEKKEKNPFVSTSGLNLLTDDPFRRLPLGPALGTSPKLPVASGRGLRDDDQLGRSRTSSSGRFLGMPWAATRTCLSCPPCRGRWLTFLEKPRPNA